jgi:chromosome segregation ATPase
MSNELQQLRLENNEIRAKEERMVAEQKKCYVPRTDFDKLLEEHKRALEDLAASECRDRYFNEVTLRAARAQSELSTAQTELTSLRTSSEQMTAQNTALRSEVASLRQAQAEGRARIHTLEADAAPGRAAAEKYSSLLSAHEELRVTHSRAVAQNADLTAKTASQAALVGFLTEQVGAQGAMKAQLERAVTLGSRQGAELEVLRGEKRACEAQLSQATARLEKAQEELLAAKEALARDTGALKADVARLTAELAGAERGLAAAQTQATALQTKLDAEETRATKAASEAAEAAKVGSGNEQKLAALQARAAELETQLEAAEARATASTGKSGKTAGELERAVAALQRELGVEQMASKRLCGDLSDARADRDAAVAVYKKLQARYALVKREFESARDENGGLRRDTAQLAQLRQQEQTAREQADALRADADTRQRQLLDLEQELRQRRREVEELRNSQAGAAEGLVQEAQRMAAENQRLRADLAQVMSSFDKLKLLADHYKSQLGDMHEATAAPHTCAKGKRCPCKTRPPPPGRWKN